MAQRAATDPTILEYARRKQPLAGEMLDPDEVAKAAVYFLSDESRAVTGQLLEGRRRLVGDLRVATTAEPSRLSRDGRRPSRPPDASPRSTSASSARVRPARRRPSPRPGRAPRSCSSTACRSSAGRAPRSSTRSTASTRPGRPPARWSAASATTSSPRCASSARSSSGRTRTAPGPASPTSPSTSRSSGSGSSPTAGARALLHATRPGRRGPRWAGRPACVVATRAGLARVRATVFVDASGDADLCAFAGFGYETAGELDPAQTLTTTFRMANVDLERRRDDPQGASSTR